MKVLAFLLSSVFLSSAAAQGTNGLPDCAKSCADGFLRNGIGNCGSDVKCICADKNFLGDIACCLKGTCPDAEQTSAVAYASTLCVAFGVTDLPTAVSCAASSTSKPASNTAAPTNAAPTPTATGGDASSPTGEDTPTATGGNTPTPNAAGTTSTTATGNYGPRQTAQAGLGAIGGIIAAAMML
ncbi:hypothetical protein V8F33_010013 [Rhypophila sp. PSN 637]